MGKWKSFVFCFFLRSKMCWNKWAKHKAHIWLSCVNGGMKIPCDIHLGVIYTEQKLKFGQQWKLLRVDLKPQKVFRKKKVFFLRVEGEFWKVIFFFLKALLSIKISFENTLWCWFKYYWAFLSFNEAGVHWKLLHSFD